MIADGTNPWKDLALVLVFFLPIFAGIFWATYVVEGIVHGSKDPRRIRSCHRAQRFLFRGRVLVHHEKGDVGPRLAVLRAVRWLSAVVFGLALAVTLARIIS